MSMGMPVASSTAMIKAGSRGGTPFSAGVMSLQWPLRPLTIRAVHGHVCVICDEGTYGDIWLLNLNIFSSAHHDVPSKTWGANDTGGYSTDQMKSTPPGQRPPR
ncbi:hypothetical protein Taro_052285 [Colocasia esculenta]|uniref:Uncharacterized protein n=1 Tax=Colocasia esculenta TaxID=4460 RepID=A0A843XJL0_COLES|nr:hypothetical protein [Colocasia esculenta]